MSGGFDPLETFGGVPNAIGFSAITLVVDRATGVDRTCYFTGGDQSASPFATIQSAIASLPSYTPYRRLIRVNANATAYTGFNLSGFSGGGDVVLAFGTSTPSLTGPTSGAAGVGSTSTTCNLPTGSGTDWSSDTLRQYFVQVPNPNDADIPYIRPIKSKTNTSFTFDAIPGFTSGTSFAIVKAGTSLAAGASTYGGYNVGGVVSFNSAPVKIAYAAPAASLDYGIYSVGNASFELHGAQVKNAATYQTIYSSGDLYSYVNDSYFSVGSTQQQNGGTAELQNVVSDGGSFLITGVNSAIIQGDAASVSGAVPLTVRRTNNVLVGFAANSCTAAEAVLFDSCTSLTQQNAGLTGSGNSAYGAEFTNGGQYNVSGASITGSSGDFSIDGSTSASQTWSNLGTYKAMSRYGGGTLLLGGSTAAELFILESLLINGTNFDVSSAQEQHGGRNINYGYFHFAAGDSYDNLTAHGGGGQGSATPCGLGVSRFGTVSNDHDSAILTAGVIGGMVQIVVNAGANILDLYPPSGGKINAITTNNPYSIAAGKVGIFWTRDDGSGGKDFVGFAVTP